MSFSDNVTSPATNITPLSEINAGGLGLPSSFIDTSTATTSQKCEKQYHRGGPKSLSGIALRSFLLGFVLSASLILTIYLSFTGSPLWRLPSFLIYLTIFHYLEFWVTARYNNPSAQVSSFLLGSNGSAYDIAHCTAFAECAITNILFPHRQWLPSSLNPLLITLGLAMIIIGQGVRSVAMIQAGTNFNHVVQQKKRDEHELVTSGLYGWFRHPSYFGFFWWALATQLALGNAVCFVMYAGFLWRFFNRRIQGEEEYLIRFFGDDYRRFRQTTGTWIPFIA